MNKVYPTVSELTSDKSYSQFLEIFNMVFPLKVETAYVNLTNLMIEYNIAYQQYKNCRILPTEQYDNLHIKAESYLEHLKELLANLSSDSPSSDYEKLVNLASAAYKNSKKKEQFGIKSNIHQDNYPNNNELAAAYYQDIVQIINAIASQLQAINELNIDDKKRIDNLCITKRHLSLIDNLSLTDVEKETLKHLLQSFFAYRLSSFKIIEKLARNIVALYQKRVLIDENSQEYQDGLNAILALQGFDMGDSIIHNVISPNNCYIINNNCTIMDLITQLFISGQMIALSDDIGSLVTDSSLKDAYRAILNKPTSNLSNNEYHNNSYYNVKF